MHVRKRLTFLRHFSAHQHKLTELRKQERSCVRTRALTSSLSRAVTVRMLVPTSTFSLSWSRRNSLDVKRGSNSFRVTSTVTVVYAICSVTSN